MSKRVIVIILQSIYILIQDILPKIFDMIQNSNVAN